MSTTTETRSAVSASAAALWQLTVTEAKLLLREPMSVILGILFPSALLLGLAAVPVLREPSPDFGGLRFIDFWAPTALVLGLGILALMHMPVVVATYREHGVLRRMSTTPVHPGLVLAAQLLVVFGAMLVASLLLLVSSWLMLDVPLPQQPVLFTAALLVGAVSLLAVGFLVAALVPSARAANGVAMVLYMLVMLIGGVFLPRFFLPEFLVRMGDVTPPGVQLLLDSWSGTAESAGLPHVAQLAAMAGIAVVAAALAAKLFRWE